MTNSESLLDPRQVAAATDLPGRRLDPRRVICLGGEAPELAAAVAGLANGSGGHLLIGAQSDTEGERIEAVPYVDLVEAEQRLRRAAATLDPPASDLLQLRLFSCGNGRGLIIANVRQSPRPPHIDPASGLIYLSGEDGVRPLRARAGLDALYEKARAERGRAERLIDAMLERLMLAQYSFYGLGVLACLQRPAADPYLWAREHIDAFADPADPFIAEWELTPKAVKVRPGDTEARGEREVAGLLRVLRSGCIAVGETRRRPPGDILGAPEDVAQRVQMMVDSACRILAHAEQPLIVPRLYAEGVRSMRMIAGRQPYAESKPLSLDMLQIPGPIGDAADAQYRQQLSQQLLIGLCAAFGLRESAAGEDAS